MSERNGFRNDLFFKDKRFSEYLSAIAGGKKCLHGKTYLDGLTVFRRYVTDTRKISMKKFRFSDCTHDFLLDFMAHLRDRGCKESTCNNRLAAVKSYLWYAADGDVSLQSIALGASGPVHEGNEAHQGRPFRTGHAPQCSQLPTCRRKWPAGYGDHGTSL